MNIDGINGVTKLTATAGKLLTDGRGTIGQVIWLGAGRAATEFLEVDAAAEQTAVESRLAAVETDIADIASVLEVLI